MPSNLLVCALTLAARDALVELVVIPCARHPDLLRRPKAGRPLEAARADAHAVAAGHLPEERRPALCTESAPGVPDAVRAVDPAKPALLGEVEVREGRLCSSPRMPGPAAAFGAVAEMHVTQRPVHLEANRTADALPGGHCRSLFSAVVKKLRHRGRASRLRLLRGPGGGRGRAAPR